MHESFETTISGKMRSSDFMADVRVRTRSYLHSCERDRICRSAGTPGTG